VDGLNLVRKAKLTKLSIRGLHHTHITELLRDAGHSSVAFTIQRYAHALPDMQQDAADETDRLMKRLT
jgi:integrase